MSVRIIVGITAIAALQAAVHAVSLGYDGRLRGGLPSVLAPVGRSASEVAASVKVYVYDLPANVSMHVEDTAPPTKGEKRAFERAFSALMQQSARRVYDPTEADFFYIPAEPINFFMARRESPGRCSKCVEADRRVVEFLRSVGPYWDQRRAQHIVPSVKCPTRPMRNNGWRLFPELWGSGAMQLCLQATRVQVDTYRALHVGYYMAADEFDAAPPPPQERDLLAVYCGATISGYRRQLVDGMRNCPDCAVLEVPASRQLPAGFAEKQRSLLRRALFHVVPPGDTLERAARDQSLGVGAVPVIFDFPSGTGQQLQPYLPVLDWDAFSVNFTLLPEEVTGQHSFWPRLQAKLRELKASGQAGKLAVGVSEVRDRFRWDSDGVLRTVLEMLAWRKVAPTEAGLQPWPATPAEQEPAAREGAAGVDLTGIPADNRRAWSAALLAGLLVLAVAPILPREGLRVFLMALAYLMSLVLVRPLVKHGMQNGYPYPYAITASHMLLTAVVASLIDRPQAKEAMQVLFLALVNGLSLVLGNTALVFGTAAFVTMIGAYTPATTLALLALSHCSKPAFLGGPGNARPRDMDALIRCIMGRTTAAVLLVCCGAALCIQGEVAFSSMALLLSSLANFCRSFKTVWQHGLMEASLSPYRTVAWTGIWSTLFMLPVVALCEGMAPLRGLVQASSGARLCIVASALAATLLNISQCLVVKYLGPLQQNLMGNLQIIMVMVIAIVWLDETVALLQWFGVAMIICGCTMTRSAASRPKAQLPDSAVAAVAPPPPEFVAEATLGDRAGAAEATA